MRIFSTRHFSSLLVLASCLLASLPFSVSAADADLSPNWSSVEKRLIKEKFSRKFIRELKKNYEPADFKNVVELNLLLFLRKADVHGVQVTDEATERVKAFMEQNKEVLSVTEKSSGVPASIIASLLWIESRYGKNLGRFQVASVFAHIIQVDDAKVLKHLKTKGALRFTESPTKADLKKIASRTKPKVKWALGELKSLARIYREKGSIAFEMRGSFAGAFGMAQFLPSSYARWARSAKPGGPPDLNNAEDAIASVGFYLKSNGWRKSREKSHMKALLNYNNSRDYANAIMSLAKKTEAADLAAASESVVDSSRN